MTFAPRIAHIGVAVPSIANALTFYREVLGLEPSDPPESADGARIVALPLGDAQVELLEPEDADGPIARFLAKRGPGIHHVCYRVADLDLALEACRRAGYRLVDQTPRSGAGGRRIAFVHPKATAGGRLPASPAPGAQGSGGTPSHGLAGFPAAFKSTALTSQAPSLVRTIVNGTCLTHPPRVSSSITCRRSPLPGTGPFPRTLVVAPRRYSCITAMRCRKSAGCPVAAAEPLLVPQSSAI